MILIILIILIAKAINRPKYRVLEYDNSLYYPQYRFLGFYRNFRYEHHPSAYWTLSLKDAKNYIDWKTKSVKLTKTHKVL